MFLCCAAAALSVLLVSALSAEKATSELMLENPLEQQSKE